MNCPACKEAMITLELDEVEVDYCPVCWGIWLDKGELELLLGDSEQAKQLLASFKTAENCSEKPRKCPICLKKMHKIFVGAEANKQLIDKCRKGDGLWFDKGELKNVLKSGSFDQHGKIAKTLTNIFGG